MFVRVIYHPDDRKYIDSEFMMCFSKSISVRAYDYTRLSKHLIYQLTNSKYTSLNKNVVFIISDKTAKDKNYIELINKFNEQSKKLNFQYVIFAMNGYNVSKELEQSRFFYFSDDLVYNQAKYENYSSYIIQGVKDVFQKTSTPEVNTKKTKSRIMKSVVYGYMVMMIGVLVYSISSVLQEASLLSEFSDVVFSTLGVSFVVIGGMICVFGMLFRYIGAKEDVKKELDLYSDKLKSTSSNYDNINVEDIDESEENKMDALALMQINLENIKEYYVWSQRQAKHAFGLAVAMSISGFLLLVISVVSMLFNDSGLEVAIVSAVGGAVVELIAGTALFVYKGSLNQLNHYHQALHEDERFLSSVNLISRFNSEEKADSMLEEIIRSEIQMNLTSVGCIDNEKKSEK